MRLTSAQYYIFGAFNAAAFVHMFLCAPETKGLTLEEMDDMFNSGLPAWKRYRGGRLEQLEKDIQEGNVKVGVLKGNGGRDEKAVALQSEEV